MIMNANFFFQCILNVGISPSRSTSKKAEHNQEKEKKKPCERKKNQNEFRLNDFRNEKKKKEIFLCF